MSKVSLQSARVILDKKTELTELSPAILELKEILLKKKTDPNLFPDIETIISAVKTIESIIELFTGGESSKLDELIDYLKKELDAIVTLLNQVVELLKHIEVVIKEEVRNFVLNNLSSSILSITASYPEWKKNPSIHKNEIYTEMYNLFNHAMTSRNYGYSHYDSMALAAGQIYSLLAMVNPNDLRIKTLIDPFISFLKAAIDYNVPNSLASKLADMASEIKALKASNPPGDIFCGVDERRDERFKWCYIEFEVHVIVSGDIDHGFEFRVTTRDNGNRRCDDHGHDPKPNNIQNANHPILMRDVDVNPVIQKYNNAHARYKYLVDGASALTKAIQSCNIYIDKLRSVVV